MADKKFTFIKRVNGTKKELTTSEAARLSAVRASLGTFMTNDEGFADDPDKPTSVLDEAMEASFMLGQLDEATLGDHIIYLVARKSGSIAPVDKTTDTGQPVKPPAPPVTPDKKSDKKDPDPVDLPVMDKKGPIIIVPLKPEDPLGGTGTGTSTGGDHVTELTLDQSIRLLAQCGITINNDKSAGVTAFRVTESGVSSAREQAVSCTTVSLHAPDSDRYDFDNYAFSSEVLQLQQWAKFTSKVSGGIPELFSVSCELRMDSANSTLSQARDIYFQSTQFLSKARVVLHEPRVTEKFVSEIAAALKTADPAKALLSVLDTYGHFVAREEILGGSIRLTYSSKFRTLQEVDEKQTSFRAAVKARFEIEGVPVGVESSSGAGSG